MPSSDKRIDTAQPTSAPVTEPLDAAIQPSAVSMRLEASASEPTLVHEPGTAAPVAAHDSASVARVNPGHTASPLQVSARTRALVFLSLLTVMELALSAAESLLPPFIPFPGVKLGLANSITLIAFSLLPRRQVFLVVFLRLLLSGLVLGSFATPVFWISFSGGMLSFLVMALCTGHKGISVIGVSLAGAATHHLGQLAAVSLLFRHTGVFYYLPWLLLWSVPVGCLTGAAAGLAISALDRAGFCTPREPVTGSRL